MLTPKKLKPTPTIKENAELKPDEVARDLETLMRNDLISGDETIAQQVFECSETRIYKFGDQIIWEGEDEDDVFFLLFGEVQITKTGKGKIDALKTPSTVGELAADDPGQPRTASVIVESESLRARVVSGSAFRAIRDSNPTFAASLHRLVSNMNRRKIAQKTEPGFLAKAAAPLVVCIASFCVAAGLLYFWSDLSWGKNLSLSALAAMMLVGLSFLLDPMHRYGRAFTAVLFATLLYGSHFGVSYFFFLDGRSSPLPFIWNFGANSEQSPGIAAAILFALLVLCIVCGAFDYLRNSQKQ